MAMNLHSEVARAYDRWHGQLGVDEEADAPWHRLVKRHLPPLEGCRVLEIGAVGVGSPTGSPSKTRRCWSRQTSRPSP
jgi:hypothetical protein